MKETETENGIEIEMEIEIRLQVKRPTQKTKETWGKTVLQAMPKLQHTHAHIKTVRI